MWNRQFLPRAGWAVLAAITLSAPAAWCQTITGAITGSVTDASGAAIAGATVTATNVSTGVATPTQTNQNGIYNLRFLQIGQYSISVSAPGFNNQSTNSFALEVSQEARIDIKMAVGSAAQTVTVTSAAPILNSENPTTGDSITAAQATELPLQARNFSSLTTLVAGAVTPNPAAQNSVARAGYNGGFFVNGNREQTNNYTLDGADINEAIDNYIGYSPNVDAIGELRVITGNATAEYGNANGGQVVMVTKSGTNQFHGDAFFFFENTNLNANSWVNKHQPPGSPIAPVPSLNRSIFGGTLGGPIIKDRLFFFIDYQGARNRTNTTEKRSVPTVAMRSGYVPSLGHNVPITNPAAIFLLSHPELYPAPNVAGVTDTVLNYQGAYSTGVHNDQGDFKIDAKLTPKDNLSGRFSIGRENNGYTKTSLPTDIPSNNNDPYTGFIVNWTHVFSPRIVSEARAGVGRTRYISTPTDLSGQLGITGNQKLGIPGTQLVAGISTLDLQAASIDPIGTTLQANTNGAYAGIDTDSIVNAFTYGDNVSWQAGRHTIKFGGQALRYQENRYYSGNDGVLGWFKYTNSGGDAWANFLQDNAFSFGQGALTGRWGQRQWRDALFFQDDYKATENLTINLGLRWEWDQPMYEVNNKQVNVNLTTGAVEDAGVNGNSRALYNGFWGGFMPRVGFAYSPDRFKGKFVVRGGYGLTNFLEGTGANLRLPLNPPFFVDSSQQSDGITYFPVQNGFPRPANAATLSGNIRVWDPHLKPALIQQFNLTTETQLTNTTSLVIAYLGQDGNHLVDPREGNQRLCPTCPLPVSSLPGLSLVQQVSLTESKSMMNYNALQITGRRRFATGFEFLTNYTWSKSLTNNLGYYGAGGGSSASQSAYWQDAYNGGGDYGPAFFDSTNIFSFSGYYDLPFGRGRTFGSGMNRALDEAVGGWKIGAVVSLHSGFPVTISSPENYFVNQRADRANQYRKLTIRGQSTDHWFGTDPSAGACGADQDNGVCAYGQESSTGFGTSRVGSQRAPGYHDLDMAASKAFGITEGTNLEFRADFFNILNTVSLSPPTNDISSSSFGQITSTVSTERQIQLALKLVF